MTFSRNWLTACFCLALFLSEKVHSQATADTPVRAGKDGVGFASCLSCPDPAYSAEARKAKVEGVVLLEAVVHPNGRATDIKVIKTLPYGLENKAIEAVKKWRFKPARGPDGKPVAVITPVEVTFRLPRN
jgi:TonB family protein